MEFKELIGKPITYIEVDNSLEKATVKAFMNGYKLKTFRARLPKYTIMTVEVGGLEVNGDNFEIWLTSATTVKNVEVEDKGEYINVRIEL